MFDYIERFYNRQRRHSTLGYVSPDFAQALLMILYFVVSIGYGILTEWAWRGQTVGKRMLRLRLVNFLRFQDGQVIEFREFSDTFDAVEQALGTWIKL